MRLRSCKMSFETNLNLKIARKSENKTENRKWKGKKLMKQNIKWIMLMLNEKG